MKFTDGHATVLYSLRLPELTIPVNDEFTSTLRELQSVALVKTVEIPRLDENFNEVDGKWLAEPKLTEKGWLLSRQMTKPMAADLQRVVDSWDMSIVSTVQRILNGPATKEAVELILNGLLDQARVEVVQHFLKTEKLRTLFPEFAVLFEAN